MVLNENFGGESALRPKSSGITNNIGKILYLSSKKKNLPLLYSHVTYLYLINYTYSP